MNFYLEKVNNENNMWKNCIYVTFSLFLLSLLYNLFFDDYDNNKKTKIKKHK
jgi:hypothetical protein